MGLDVKRYWEERLGADATLGGVGWTGLGASFNRWMYAVRLRVFKRVVRAEVPVTADSHVLDVGSGTGFYLDAWRALGATRIEGSDLTDAATARLRAARPGTPIHQLDIGGAAGDLPSGPFDAVSAMDMLFHIVDPDAYARAIANLASLVRPSGHVVLTENLLTDGAVSSPHQVSRPASEITDLLRANGLEPVASAPMFVLLNTPVDSRSPLLHRWWATLTKVAGVAEPLGWLLGAVVFPFELVAVRLAKRGPSTKLLVCRRVPAP